MPATWIRSRCPDPSLAHETAARERQAQLTKPPGSLGVLEDLVITLAALQRKDKPRAATAPIVLFAGDHGVTAQGISAFPSQVTVEMLKNFAAGGAAISVLARELGSTLTVVDAGTLAETIIPGVIVDKPCRGTRDFAAERALTSEELNFAFEAGRRQLTHAVNGGVDLVLFGEMGIGNTTSAAAIASALLGTSPLRMAGRGTGLDAPGVERKAEVIAKALALHGLNTPSPEPQDVLAAVGGLEIAALTGAIIAAAQGSVPVLVDGFIVTVAALAACRINASCRPWLLFSHRSAEQGHRLVLEGLNARPIMDLGLRLGEGSGAATALPILRLACALHAGMATFAEAAVSGKTAP